MLLKVDTNIAPRKYRLEPEMRNGLLPQRRQTTPLEQNERYVYT